MIEYLMLAGVNDSVDDAAELADWVAGLDVHINLIPYNAMMIRQIWLGVRDRRLSSSVSH